MPVRFALALLLGVALVACSGEPETPQAASSESPPPTTAAPAPPRPDPEVGSCHRLSFANATEAVDGTDGVRCRRPHTSVTYEVGHLDLLVDGHLVAMDSETVSDQLNDTCARGLGKWLGGGADDLRLSRFRDVWFRPDVREADRGASWYRCDVVAVAREGELASFRGNLKGVLDDEDALDTWGICGTASPVKRGFEKVICSQEHAWRAASIFELPTGVKYLGKRAAAQADAACQDEATSRVNESLKFEWAFQWPTREEWNAGQRYGWCWLPADA